jgi:hypothetical protein
MSAYDSPGIIENKIKLRIIAEIQTRYFPNDNRMYHRPAA